ncbi:CDC27 family protein [Pontiellaceae bacterium B1224]|nr:CDC27 family protein [Pontiellaceae bacterium B1224]
MKISPIVIPALFSILLQTAPAQETNSAAPAAGGLQINSRTDEERIQFLLEIAQVYYKEKNFDSAVNAYERILEIDPEHKEARYIIAHVYIDAKQYTKAETLLIELGAETPEDFKLKNNLAWLYATAEDPKVRNGAKAVRIAQEAMVLAPNDHHVWSTLSEAHYINGEYEKAYRAIEQMAALASRYGQGLTQENVDSYNEQIRKCKRAWDTQKMLEGEDEE